MIPASLLEDLKKPLNPQAPNSTKDGPSSHSRRHRSDSIERVAVVNGEIVLPKSSIKNTQNYLEPITATTNFDNFKVSSEESEDAKTNAVIQGILHRRKSENSPEFHQNIVRDRYPQNGKKTDSGSPPISPKSPNFPGFIYQKNTADTNSKTKDIKVTSNFMPEELRMVTGNFFTEDELEAGSTGKSVNNSSRKEVLLLRHAMDTMLSRIGVNANEDYPSEMHTLLSVIQEEQKVYDMVFKEIIRQVSVHMHERGEILAELRDRYVKMFNKVPRQVRSLHTELLAQRRLNRKLSEELVRSKDNMQILLKELEIVRKHDADVTKLAHEAQQKLIAVLTQSDNTDEILEEYHKLYRMQRDRLEDLTRKHGTEKKVWIDAATNLALKIGSEHGMNEIADLHRYEQTRLRASNHIIVHISNKNEFEIRNLEKKVGVWRTRLLRISHAVTNEDQDNLAILQRMQKELLGMTRRLRNVEDNDDDIETDFPILQEFSKSDVKGVGIALLRWTQQVIAVSQRFTSDKDMGLRDEIKAIRTLSEEWMETANAIFTRLEKTSKYKDYDAMQNMIAGMSTEIEEWLKRLDLRIAGEDGVAGLVIGLQNQLEDKYAIFSVRDFSRPLTGVEKSQLADAIDLWEEQTRSVLEILSDTFEREQSKIPLVVENWLSRILDQASTDQDVRNEESAKLHNSMVSWLVNFLVNTERTIEAEVDLSQLHQEIRTYNTVLLKDSEDLELPSDENGDLKTIMVHASDSWMLVSKKLLRNDEISSGQGEKDEEAEKEQKTSDTEEQPDDNNVENVTEE